MSTTIYTYLVFEFFLKLYVWGSGRERQNVKSFNPPVANRYLDVAYRQLLTPRILSQINTWMSHTDKHDLASAPIMFTSTKEKGIMKILTIICTFILILVAVMAFVISAQVGIFYLTGFSFLCLVGLTYSLNSLLLS